MKSGEFRRIPTGHVAGKTPAMQNFQEKLRRVKTGRSLQEGVKKHSRRTMKVGEKQRRGKKASVRKRPSGGGLLVKGPLLKQETGLRSARPVKVKGLGSHPEEGGRGDQQ